jgi:hypothetical protein
MFLTVRGLIKKKDELFQACAMLETFPVAFPLRPELVCCSASITYIQLCINPLFFFFFFLENWRPQSLLRTSLVMDFSRRIQSADILIGCPLLILIVESTLGSSRFLSPG